MTQDDLFYLSEIVSGLEELEVQVTNFVNRVNPDFKDKELDNLWQTISSGASIGKQVLARERQNLTA